MIFGLTIAAATKLLKSGTFVLTETTNRRCTASFSLDSIDRSYRAAENAEVIITEDGGRIFAGLIDAPTESGLGGPKHPGIRTTVTAVDFQVYAERKYFLGTLAAGTLKSQLTTLTAEVSGFGVTLHASQVNGPTMPDLVYSKRTRMDVVLNQLMTLTADAGQPFVWEIDYFKVLRAYQPSTTLAPFDLVGDDLPEVIGDIEVETRRSDQYANKIYLEVAPKTEIEREETFTEGIDTYPYQPQYIPFKTYGYVTHQGIFETLRIPPDPDPASWTYDPTTNELTRDAGAPGAGEVTIFKFDGTFSGTWIADAGAAPADLVEQVITLNSIPNDTTGQAFADAELAKRNALIQTVTYTTWEQGIEIGQQQTINVPSRNVNGTAVIVEVRTRDLVHRLERSVTAVIDPGQTNLDRSAWTDYERWYGDESGGGGSSVSAPSVGTGFTGGGGPGGPHTSVQFNNAGAFGGDAEFTYNKDTNSVVCGALSSITASNPESCQAFGYDTHIADP